jgi:hypothetical protein
VKIGAAIFEALGDDGHELFTNWSAQSPRNDPPATFDKWRSFRASAMDISAATLFWEARQNGWLSERERLREEARRFSDEAAARPDDAPGEPPPRPDDRGNHISLNQDVSMEDPVAALIQRLNKQYMVINEAGKAVIYAPAEDPILHRRYFDRLGFSDLRQLYLNERIEIGRDNRGNPIMRP